VPQRVLTGNGTQFKGGKFVRCYADFGIHHQPSSVAHPRTNGQVEWAMGSVLWALHTNVNRVTRDTLFNLVYRAEAVLPPEVYLESARVAHFNAGDQAEPRELYSNLLEERCNTVLANVRKYKTSLKRYDNKGVVLRELNVRDLVLKKDIRAREKHKFSSSWEGPFIIVEEVAPAAYVLAEVDGGMLPNTWNVDQLHKYYA
jgi:hypothetical protein